MAGKKAFLLRIDPALWAEIERLAQAELRSANEWLNRWRAYATLKAVRTARLLPWTDPRLSRLGPSMVDATASLCDALDHPN